MEEILKLLKKIEVKIDELNKKVDILEYKINKFNIEDTDEEYKGLITDLEEANKFSNVISKLILK